MKESDKPKKRGGYRGGSRKGCPNRATAEVREAIRELVDGNVFRLQQWLDTVADGVINDEGEYLVPPNPEKAFWMVQALLEFTLPKLQRTNVAVSSEMVVKTFRVLRVKSE